MQCSCLKGYWKARLLWVQVHDKHSTSKALTALGLRRWRSHWHNEGNGHCLGSGARTAAGLKKLTFSNGVKMQLRLIRDRVGVPWTRMAWCLAAGEPSPALAVRKQPLT